MISGGDSVSGVCVRCGFDSGGERSPRSQRFFHAVLQNAYENWPHRHPHQPTSCEHLRAWLLAHPKVEWCGTIEGPVTALPEFEDICHGLRSRGLRFFLQPREETGELVLRVPRTTVLAGKGGPRRGQFYALIDRVLALIEAETGLAREDLRREGLAAVAPRPKLGKRAA
jgi:hypothetical protein